MLESEGLDEEYTAKLKLIFEQFELVQKAPQGRRYSSSMLQFSFLFYSHSPQAYRFVLQHQCLSLPSERTIRQLSQLDVNDDSYLKTQIEHLSDLDKAEFILIDEIYIAKRIEYSNGKLLGLTEESAVAGTVLVFMIASVATHYHEVVKMIPIGKIKADIIRECHFKVLKQVII